MVRFAEFIDSHRNTKVRSYVIVAEVGKSKMKKAAIPQTFELFGTKICMLIGLIAQQYTENTG